MLYPISTTSIPCGSATIIYNEYDGIVVTQTVNFQASVVLPPTPQSTSDTFYYDVLYLTASLTRFFNSPLVSNEGTGSWVGTVAILNYPTDIHVNVSSTTVSGVIYV